MSQLQAFVSVAQQASFSKAAEALFLTQPAVSKRISTLESLLGQRLFDRIGHRVLLTEAGRMLLPHALTMLEEWSNSRQSIRNLSGEIAGTLHIITSHHIGLHRLPNVLNRFSKHYPGVDLHLAFAESESACRRVEQGEFDFGIITLPGVVKAPLTRKILWRDRLQVVVGRDHPLAHTPVNRAQLRKHPAVLPPPQTITRRLIEKAFGDSLSVKLSVDNLETIKMLVGIGFAWSCLPEIMLDDSLRVVDAGLHIERNLGVLRLKQRTLSNAATAFLNCMAAGE